ncbi:MAG: hypothetical protein ABEH66_07720 [Halobacteriales archaeon]
MSALVPGTISVHADNVDLVDGVCGSVACEIGGVPIRVGLALLTVLFALGLFAALKHISEAKSVLAEERKRTTDERDALAAFRRRVAALEATEPPPAGGDTAVLGAGAGTPGGNAIAPGGPVAASAGPPDGQLDRLLEAYRETVMSVPHYEDEYDEPIEVNMTAELGEEVATAVFDGAAFTPHLKHAVVQQSQEGRTRREELLDVIDREADRLSGTGEELREIEAALDARRADHPGEFHRLSFDELSARWDELGEVEGRCENLIENRQPSPASDRWTRGGGDVSFREYAYQSLPTTHPVLSDATRLLDRIQETRRDVLRALTRRV